MPGPMRRTCGTGMDQKDKFDRKDSAFIIEKLLNEFSKRDNARQICALVCDAYNEAVLEYPLESETKRIDSVIEQCPDLFNEIKSFVESVFKETHSFDVKFRHFYTSFAP